MKEPKQKVDKDKKKSEKKPEDKKEQLDQDQKPGLPDVDLKKFMGCGG